MKSAETIVTDALADVIGVVLKDDQKELDLIENELIDSLAMMDLIAHMENDLGKRIDSKNFSNEDFRSFAAIVSLLNRI